MTIRITQRSCQLLIAVGALVLLVILAAQRLWPFDYHASPTPRGKSPSFWQFILSDRVTVGFLRVAIIALGFFAIASVPALMVAGRWLKSFGSGGLAADDAASAAKGVDDIAKKLEDATTQLDSVTRERNELRQLLASLLSDRGTPK